MKKLYLILALAFISLSCTKQVLLPEVKGSVFNKGTSIPVKDVSVALHFGMNVGMPIPFHVTTDSLGHFHFLQKTELSLPLIAIESGEHFLCSSCVVVLRKEGFKTDSIYLKETDIEFDFEKRSYAIDSLFFTAIEGE